MTKIEKTRYDRKHTNILMGLYMILDGLVMFLTLGRYHSYYSADYAYKRLKYDLERRKEQRVEWEKKVAEYKRMKDG